MIHKRYRYKGPVMEIELPKDMRVAYDSEGGQHIIVEIPAGTKFEIPAKLIYGD